MSVVNCYLIFGEDTTDKTVCVRQPPACDASLCSAHTVRESVYQVFASLLVSTVLLGFKLSVAKRLVQVNQRRIELQEALSLLQPKVEEEELAVFLADVQHDTSQRQAWIAEMASPSGRMYSTTEIEALEKCSGMLEWFDSSSDGVTQLTRPVSIMRLETKTDPATRRLMDRVEANIRADPWDVVAYILNLDSRVVHSVTAADANLVRFECLGAVNAHHTVGFGRFKAPGVMDRTFLASSIAKHVAEDPPTFEVAVVAVPRHEKIVPKDEVGAIRAEVYRSFRITEVAPGTSKLETSGSVDLHGWVPQILADTIVVPTQLAQLRSLQSYFQHVRPLSECDAEDGQLVGKLLIDLVNSTPKELARAIRTFTNRTAMLRECGFHHIGTMLASLLNAERQGDHSDAPITALSPSAVTEQQAAAIGNTIASSVRRSHVPATAVQKVVKSFAVLQAMKSGYAWFVPMLEVLTAPKHAAAHRLTFMKRLTATVVDDSVVDSVVRRVAPIDAETESDADAADGDFSSVVRSRPSLPPSEHSCAGTC